MEAQVDVHLTEDGVALTGPAGQPLATLPKDRAVSLARHILHLTEGVIEPERTYQKDLG